MPRLRFFDNYTASKRRIPIAVSCGSAKKARSVRNAITEIRKVGIMDLLLYRNISKYCNNQSLYTILVSSVAEVENLRTV